MTPYTLLIIGFPSPSWDKAIGVFGMLTYGMTEAFGALPHVTVKTADIRDVKQHPEAPLPQADIVLEIVFCADEQPNSEIKRRTGATHTASFRENPSNTVDHSFWLDNKPLRLPCCKRMMVNVPKEPGLVLLDHRWWCEPDWTKKIEGWLADYHGGQVYRLIRYANDETGTPDYINLLEYLPYPAYLKATERFERHIITHIEGYGFGIVDFAARGTQVLAPPDLIPKEIVAELGIPIFRSKDELLSLLAAPVGPEWNRKIDLCTDYTDCAKVIDQHFQSVL